MFTCNTEEEINSAFEINDVYIDDLGVTFSYYVVDYKWYEDTALE